MFTARKSSVFYILSVLLVLFGLIYFGFKLLPEKNTLILKSKMAELLQDGDIIFQTSTSRQSKAIQAATGSVYSHMGIIYRQNNQVYVYEAVQSVKLTRLIDWIRKGDKDKFVVKRLKNASSVLTPENVKKMKAVGARFQKKNYDLYFEWTNDRIYCSELVWKIYKEGLDVEIGKLEKLKNFNLTDPAVQNVLKERYGNAVPLDETVISPMSMFNSDKLELIIEN